MQPYPSSPGLSKGSIDHDMITPAHTGIFYQVEPRRNSEGLPTLILIHGAGGNHLFWPAEMRRISGIKVIAIDLPGHGNSPGSSASTIQSYVQQLLDWMDAVGISQAALAGHSMGGAIALHLAIFHPDRVCGLALISTAAKLEVSARLLELTQNPDSFHEAIKTILQYSFSPQTPERLRQLAEARMTEVTWQTLHNDFLACHVFDLTEYLNQVDQPTLVICGEEDQMTPLRYSQQLVTGIRGAHLEILLGLGHMAMLEEPKIVANLLGNFFSFL